MIQASVYLARNMGRNRNRNKKKQNSNNMNVKTQIYEKWVKEWKSEGKNPDEFPLECPISYIAFESNTLVSKTDCNHFFSYESLRKWIVDCDKDRCPLCNRKIIVRSHSYRRMRLFGTTINPIPIDVPNVEYMESSIFYS